MENEINENLKLLSQDLRLEKKLSDTLLTVGISPNLSGYTYLKDCVKFAIVNPVCLMSITKVMYPEIAKKCNTTASRVERGIRHALDVAYNKGRLIQINKIYGFKIFDKKDKPTNSEFVALIADKLSLEFNHLFDKDRKKK